MTTSPTPTPEPSGLMFACLTDQGTAAAETAVCSQHLTGYTPWLRADDVTDWSLVDCTGNAALACSVCGADAADLAYLRDRGHNVRPTTTVTFTVPAVLTVTVEVDGEPARYYPGAHRAWIEDVAVAFVPDTRAVEVGFDGPDPALGVVDAAEVLRLARVEVDVSGIYPAPHWA